MMENVAAMFLKESVLAGLLALVLFYMMRTQDRRLRQLEVAHLIVASVLNQLSLQLNGHDMTVIGVNPAVDVSNANDQVRQQIAKRYEDMAQNYRKIEDSIAKAIDELNRGK